MELCTSTYCYGAQHLVHCSRQYCWELDATIEKANAFDGASYIEVMIPTSESQPLPIAIQNQIYKSNIPN
ncbi:hypothetical protein [Polynucleobacter necessarius]|uniref:hypothetical protein n=1 Tax=Polynucleobacter necessarius TaxID=576610 RepID=UPI000E09E07A|nr:hypothetical protein [Polynucleobacter necessarius]